MDIHCNTCGAPLDEGAMDRERGLARCRHCDTVVELDFTRNEPMARAKGERAPVAMPARFSWESSAGRLLIRWKWFSPMTLLWLGGAVIWFAVLGTVLTTVLTPDGIALNSAGLPQILVALGFLAFGAMTIYLSACGVLNTTTIAAVQGSLHIQHAPLPWPGGGTVDGIKQLYSVERDHKPKTDRRTYSYQLWAITTGGRERRLIGMLEDAGQALWLEQTLEEHLGIRDRPVGGELPRH